MTKRKKNHYQAKFFLACAMIFLIGVWQAKTREDLKNKVSALSTKVSSLQQVYEQKCEENQILAMDKLILESDLDNMKHYAWKLEKVIEKGKK